MNILTIGSDRKIFDETSNVKKRVVDYGSLVNEYYVIVFTQKSLGLKIKQLSGNTWAIPTNSSNKWFYIWDAYKIGRKMAEIDLVSSQDPFESGLAGFLISRFLKTKFQIQIHTDFKNPYFKKSFLNKIRLILAGITLPKADLIRVVSTKIKKSLKDYKLKAKITILPIFVDLEKNESKEALFDVHDRFPTFSKIILMTTRLEEEKRVSLALKVFKGLIKKHKDIALVIVGDGRERKNLVGESKKLGINKNVFFEGWRDDLISYYKTSDVLLSTSLYEGYGLSLIEASSLGLPVVTTDVGIAGDILINNTNALVCPVEDFGCLRDSLTKLIEDESLYEKLKKNSLNVSERLIYKNKFEYLDAYKKSWRI
ncbi:MAG: glycosyltransferase [Candidatus Pacebacteria bacterium]|jgi:glycosyltransferase involved in cell wall biosynthesis|nr:hypothetical protein [Parcubacteria group bacterium]MDP6119761.1 glycosyltransferase [Candidatus Paceibacterota bacterium]|tara:strand:+ start:17198 stop:18304 length:1107 start_codon:yes stop_codon:yes gene_type:complete